MVSVGVVREMTFSYFVNGGKSGKYKGPTAAPVSVHCHSHCSECVTVWLRHVEFTWLKGRFFLS